METAPTVSGIIPEATSGKSYDTNSTKERQSKLQTGVAIVNKNKTSGIPSIPEGTDDSCQLMRN